MKFKPKFKAGDKVVESSTGVTYTILRVLEDNYGWRYVFASGLSFKCHTVEIMYVLYDSPEGIWIRL